MPFKQKPPCKAPGCNKLVLPGTKYCSLHKTVDKGKTTYEKGYDYKWRKARKNYLKNNPLCIRCLDKGIYKESTVVDHIIPHRGNKKIFWNKENWQALCKSCHDKKTMTEDNMIEYKY